LRLRHSITNTNYYVGVFTDGEAGVGAGAGVTEALAGFGSLQQQIPAAAEDLEWVETGKLAQMPLTGLARKVLQRLAMMDLPRVTIG
jgi:A/G-specific adenine glycosylase